MFTRREMFRTTATGAAALAAPALFATARATDDKPPKGKKDDKNEAAKVAGFTLPKLPYAFDALEPSIDAKTMEIHHDKHHAGYVKKLNDALAGHDDWLSMTPLEVISNLAKVPEDIRTKVRQNGGGHYNHSLFWTIMTPEKKSGEPKGELKKAIEDSFGTCDTFMTEFADAAGSQFGSGWAWLVPGTDKPLKIVASANQDNPVMAGMAAPILGIDVWEHAYYLKYQNKRPDYIAAWMKVVNWDQVAANFNDGKKAKG